MWVIIFFIHIPYILYVLTLLLVNISYNISLTTNILISLVIVWFYIRRLYHIKIFMAKNKRFFLKEKQARIREKLMEERYSYR